MKYSIVLQTQVKYQKLVPLSVKQKVVILNADKVKIILDSVS